MLKILVLFLIFFPKISHGSFCGSNAAPYSLEAKYVTTSGIPILGCAISSCLGLEQANGPITNPQFYQIDDGRFDGFVRGIQEEWIPYSGQLSNGPPSQAICDPIPTTSCGSNQWVGGIYSIGNGSTPLQLICCTVPPAIQLQSTPYGMATVSNGAIYDNGNVYPTAFDYINNIAKITNLDGNISYSVAVNRAQCAARIQYVSYPSSYSNNLYCFSGDTLVITKNGTQKRMDQLKINDWILTSSEKANHFSPVVSWLHKMPEIEAEFVKVTLKKWKKEEEERILKLTKLHYIYKGDCSALHQVVPPRHALRDMVFAKNLSLSDCLFLHDPKTFQFIEYHIQKIETLREKGIYSPMTENGNIIVNGILASCSSMIDDKNLQITFAESLQRFVSNFSKRFRIFHEIIGIDLIPGMENLIRFLKFVIPQK